MADTDSATTSSKDGALDPMIVHATRMMGMDAHWSEKRREVLAKLDGDNQPAAALDSGNTTPVAVAPTRLIGRESSWRCNLLNLSSRQRSVMLPRGYGHGLGKLQPILFNESGALRVLMLQGKGGVGRTTHALNLAATLSVDGSELWTQGIIWECLKQTGLRAFLGVAPDGEATHQARHLDAIRIPVLMGESRSQTTQIQVVLAPERASDALSPAEAGRLYRVLNKKANMLLIDVGAVDPNGTDDGALTVRTLLSDESLYVLIPVAPNLGAWGDASALIAQLTRLGVSSDRIWGVAIDEMDPKHPLGPGVDAETELFGGRLARVPYSQLLLERSLAEGLLPIFAAPALRNAYRDLLEQLLTHWLSRRSNMGLQELREEARL